ncbi:hypothetical protein V8C26DRAFT_328571 [Trichoderma gracile]
MPRHLRTSLPHAEWLCDTRAQELQRERMVPSKRYRSLDLTRKSESVACRTPTLSESPPSLDKQQRRGGGTPTLIRVVDGSPRGVALGAKNCLDDSKRESRDTRVPGSAVFQGPLEIGNVMLHRPRTPLAIVVCRAIQQIAPCLQATSTRKPSVILSHVRSNLNLVLVLHNDICNRPRIELRLWPAAWNPREPGRIAPYMPVL